MSSTEIFCFNKDGLCCQEYAIKNAWRGAMAVWGIMEEKYLPPYRPSYVPVEMSMQEFEQRFGFKPRRLSATLFATEAVKKENPAEEIWELFEDKTIVLDDRIVLGTTFDWVLVRHDEIEKVVRAFRNFGGETNLKEQADILAEIVKDENISAIGWNQTSVNADTWMNAGGPFEERERQPYNYLEQDKHWWLFDELEGKR